METPPRVAEWRAKRRNTRFRLLEFTHNELVSHGLRGAFAAGEVHGKKWLVVSGQWLVKEAAGLC